VNDHVRRTVPRLVSVRKDIDFQKVELEKSSCDIDEILPTVKTIGSLTSFKTMQTLLLKSIQLSSPKPPPPSPTSSSRTLVPSQQGFASPQVAGSSNVASRSISAPGSPFAPNAPPPSLSQAPPTLVSLEPRVDSSSDLSEMGIVENDEPFTPPPSTTSPAMTESQIQPMSHGVTATTFHIEGTYGEPRDDVSTASSLAPADEPLTSSPKLTQEEMILGNRAHGSMKKKKRTGSSGATDGLVPKAF